jgi:preprotein translocase subunit SecA
MGSADSTTSPTALPIVRTPTDEDCKSFHRRPERLLNGLDAQVLGLLGVYYRRSHILQELSREAELIDSQALKFTDLSDHLLRARLRDFRDGFRRGGRNQGLLIAPALAAIREAADREIGLRPFLVQLIGALALHRGYLAEMATGEGKTLTAGLAAVLAGWTRNPCHIITVNDYLVQRDSKWLKPLYEFCGVKVGFVTGQMPPEERRNGYACDVTYSTSKEVVADFLRDGIQAKALRNPSRRLIQRMLANNPSVADDGVMRGLHTAIVDEADSVLIDEAVVPLIIATPRKNEALREVIQIAHGIVEPLEPGTDYRVDARYREIELTPSGLLRIGSACSSLPGLWRGEQRRNELIKQALSAREFYENGKQYVLSEDRVLIIDEFTGRPMPQRSWRQGIHQAIEAKEKLPLTDPTETIARMSFQKYFRFYHRLSGMTGTAREAAGELWQIYRLPVVSIPTNRPCVRREIPDRVFATEEAKWQAIADEVCAIHRTGRPLLIGTRSVLASERLAENLTAHGVAFRLLNAVRHQEEAQIIAEAGSKGQITIATNMAGRGTDIKLGPGVAELGGLHVIATERHESKRVDRQLFGRAARQGDPGSAQAFVSVEDELLRRFLPAPFRSLLLRGQSRTAQRSHTLPKAALAWAQHTSQREASRRRREVLRMDDWLGETLSFAGAAPETR